jgi:hypothetical protein
MPEEDTLFPAAFNAAVSLAFTASFGLAAGGAIGFGCGGALTGGGAGAAAAYANLSGLVLKVTPCIATITLWASVVDRKVKHASPLLKAISVAVGKTGTSSALLLRANGKFRTVIKHVGGEGAGPPAAAGLGGAAGAATDAAAAGAAASAAAGAAASAAPWTTGRYLQR